MSSGLVVLAQTTIYPWLVSQAPIEMEPVTLTVFLVWIYGGGFTSGASSLPYYNLSFIVEESVQMGTPVIAVSLNYRLHCWGFMWSEEISNEGSGNLGFRDQRLALHWIQESMYTSICSLSPLFFPLRE
jgi:carboxylesterase type B